MPKRAYCAECGRYIDLTPSGDCPEGHPRSALRDVREGTAATAPVVGAARAAADESFRDYNSVFAQVLGKGIVIVPVALIVAFGLWTGYEQFSGMGMSFLAKLGLSVVSLLMTVGGAFLLAGRKRR